MYSSVPLLLLVVLALALCSSLARATPNYPLPYCSANSSVSPVLESWLESGRKTEHHRANGYRLRQVQIVFRHGDRTPVAGFPNDETLWLCNLDSLDNVGIGSYSQSVDLDGLIFRQLQLFGRNVLRGNCSLGELTTIGHVQHNIIGANFRKLYVDYYGFMPSTYTAGTLFARNNNIPRCYESMQSELQGLYPVETRGDSTMAIPVFTMDPQNEDMSPNFANCPALLAQVAAQQQSPEWLAFEARTAQLTAELLAAFGLKNASQVASVMYPFYIDAYDQLACRNCHGLLQPQFTESLFSEMVEAATWTANNWLFNVTTARLGIGAFLGELVDAMTATVNGAEMPLMLLYAGQDLTVGPLLITMGVYDGVWPAYASHLSLELWQQESNNAWFVRVLYNGEELVLPACGEVFCPFNTFTRAVEPFVLSLEQYAAECAATYQSRQWNR